MVPDAASAAVLLKQHWMRPLLPTQKCAAFVADMVFLSPGLHCVGTTKNYQVARQSQLHQLVAASTAKKTGA